MRTDFEPKTNGTDVRPGQAYTTPGLDGLPIVKHICGNEELRILAQKTKKEQEKNLANSRSSIW